MAAFSAIPHLEGMKTDAVFRCFAKWFAHQTGRPITFALALVVVISWAASGPLFGFSDTWQLVINTGTTIVTFLMVFLIQNTQNRDTEALQLKLDELIRVSRQARDSLIDTEDLPEQEVERIRKEFRREGEGARRGAV